MLREEHPQDQSWKIPQQSPKKPILSQCNKVCVGLLHLYQPILDLPFFKVIVNLIELNDRIHQL